VPQVGFCNYADHESAAAAVENIPKLKFDDEVKIYAVRQKSKAERKAEVEKKTAEYKRELYNKTKDRNFYVRGFPEDTEENDLIEVFSKYGEIESSRIMKNENNKQRVYACVELVKNEDAKKLLEDSYKITIRGSPIYVAKFKPAEKRAQERSQKSNQTNKSLNEGNKMLAASNPVNTPQAESPLDIFKNAILEECADEEKDTAKFLQASKQLSPDQIQILNSDGEKFQEWFKKVDEQN